MRNPKTRRNALTVGLVGFVAWFLNADSTSACKWRVTGRVLSQEGIPLSGAQVDYFCGETVKVKHKLLNWPYHTTTGTVTTEADGTFHVAAKGFSMALTILADGFQPEQRYFAQSGGVHGNNPEQNLTVQMKRTTSEPENSGD
jgi:hypothetical protein